MKPRVLVLLVVAILATTPHPAALTAPLGAITTETPAGPTSPGAPAAPAADPDVLDTALRPPARQGHRPTAPLRPARHPKTAHPEPSPHSGITTYDTTCDHRPSPTLHALRCVVLRC
ncbi:hypothetical protein ACFWFF_34160 [Streptomyces sp. NPDC060223]|uniref:hypothetical protein n=1 Tax=unclassified Streptomyces TaxID=2593676 RepID=UPI003635294A